jgi:simple sugar transport system substrate-binding protein
MDGQATNNVSEASPPTEISPEKSKKRGFNRRQMLLAGGAGGIGLIVGACGSTASSSTGSSSAATSTASSASGLAQTKKGSLVYVGAGGGDYELGIQVGFHEALTPLGWSFQALIPQGPGTGPEVTQLIEEAIAKSPTALAVAYPGSGAGVQQIHQAHQQLQFVICTNQFDNPYTQKEGIAFVGQDVEAAGTLGMQKLLGLITAKGKKSGTIICGNEAPGGSSILARFQGAESAVKAYNTANGTTFTLINMPDFATEGAKGVETYKAKALQLGGNLAGIYTLGFDSTALMPSVGAAIGLKPGELVIGGFDTGPAVSKAIQDGWVQFTIDQQFYSQGSISGWLSWQAVNRDQVPPPISNTGAAFVDKSNIDAIAARDNQLQALAKQYGFTAA